MVEQEGDNRDKTPNSKVEVQNKEKGCCLYVCINDGDKSPTNIAKKVEALGYKVDKKSDFSTAAKVCATTKMDLIIVEDCEDKEFIKGIKSPKACNEHTPIVFISSGPLSDVVRDLMQEQYIDELVFKCLTLECDLGSAVNRLMLEPGQFAVTPKLKKPSSTKKRKLETAFSSKNGKDSKNGGNLSGTKPGQTDTGLGPTHWQNTHHVTPNVPMLPPFPQGFDYNSYPLHMNPFMNGMPQMQPHAAYEHAHGDGFPGFHPPAGQMPYGAMYPAMNHSSLPPHPYPEVHFQSRVYTGSAEAPAGTKWTGEPAVQDLDKMHPSHLTIEHPHPQLQQQRASVIVKAADATTEQEESEVKDVPGEGDTLEIAKKAIEIMTNDLGDKTSESAPEEDSSEKEVENQSAEKEHNTPRQIYPRRSSESPPTRIKTPRENKPRRKPGSTTASERKEQHLDKEKKRRERVTRSWHWLRRLVPNCETYADKATVFEMTVAYLHHCWKYHGKLLQQINKDFAGLNESSFPPEDMEDMVSCLLEKESAAFGNTGQSSSNTGK